MAVRCLRKTGDEFKFVIGEDITKDSDGALQVDEAANCKGVDAVEHLANPVPFDAEEDPKELIEAAAQGIAGMILESVKLDERRVGLERYLGQGKGGVNDRVGKMMCRLASKTLAEKGNPTV